MAFFIEFDHFWSTGVQRGGVIPLGPRFLGTLKIVVVCLFARGKFFKSVYIHDYCVRWSPWRVPFDFFKFSKIPISGGVAAFFKNRGQFTKSSFCCLLPVFVPIRAIKWLFFIEFDLFGQSEC